MNSVQKLGVPVLFITITAVHGSCNGNYALQEPFETDIFTVIGNAKLRP